MRPVTRKQGMLHKSASDRSLETIGYWEDCRFSGAVRAECRTPKQ
jgi:hypothetical protein